MFECFGGVSGCKRIKSLSFHIVLCENQVYTPDSVVSGYCIIHLDGEINLNQLEIKLEGKARVSWHEGRGGRRTASEHCLKLNYNLPENDQMIIKCGEHRIPFRFQLPHSNIASSFEGDYGSIRYELKAEIRQSNVLSVNYKTRVPITITSPANFSAKQLKCRRVCDAQKTVGLCCCAKGFVSLKCETTCGQLVGKEAMIHCYVDNRTNSRIRLRAKLKQIIRYTVRSCDRKKEKTITFIVAPNIQPHSLEDECLSLKIPLELSVSSSHCQLINIEYEIVVTVDVPFPSNLRVCLPIIITNQEFITFH